MGILINMNGGSYQHYYGHSRTPSEAADAGELLWRGAHSVTTDGVLEHEVDDRLVEPRIEVVVCRQLPCGAGPATIEEAGPRCDWQRPHDVAENNAAPAGLQNEILDENHVKRFTLTLTCSPRHKQPSRHVEA
jgi:hypothetical protein